jgi:hypothetical protein
VTLPANWADGGLPFHASDENAVEAVLNLVAPLTTTTIYSNNTSPIIGQTSYYNASGGNRTPTLPALSGLQAGQRLAVRRDPADSSTNTVTLSCASGDSFYSSGSTSTTFPLSGEQREFQVISVSGSKYWVPAGSLNPISGLVTNPSNVVITGGHLDGVTIGATTAAPSIAARALSTNVVTTLTGASKPWLSQTGSMGGTLTGTGQLNSFAINDTVVMSSSTTFLYGLELVDNVFSPAVGPRNAIYGTVRVNSSGTGQTLAQAQYVGVSGKAETLTGFGGTSSSPVGSYWGGWFYASIGAGTYHNFAAGIEIDMSIAAGSSVYSKCGLFIALAAADAVSGSVVDTGICIGAQAGVSSTWRNAIMIGGTAHWPFDNTSTLIIAGNPNGVTGLNPGGACAIGIDLSDTAPTGPSLKLPAAPIAMAAMSSAPSAVAGEGQLYISSTGALRYRGPTTDTQVAPA